MNSKTTLLGSLYSNLVPALRLEGLDYVLNVSTPAIKGLFAFEQEIMPLIDGGNAGNRACLMVEDLVGNVRGHA